MSILVGIIRFIGIVFILSIPAFILQVFVVMKLWLWFIVPLGLNPIKFVPAIGFSLIISFLTKQYIPVGKDKWGPLIHAYVDPVLTLFIGWIITWFI